MISRMANLKPEDASPEPLPLPHCFYAHRQQFETLRKVHAKKSKHVDALKRQLKIMDQKINYLYNQCIEGASPIWALQDMAIESDKKIIRTLALDELRRETLNKHKGQALKAITASPKQLTAISKFLARNGEYKRGDVDIFNDDEWCSASRLLVDEKMTSTHRIAALRGQRGLIARRNIEDNVVLGQYFGAEIQNTLYDDAFIDRGRLHTHNMYSFGMHFQDADRKEYSFCVDPYIENEEKDEKNSKLLTYINDCRFDIENPKVSDADGEFCNVEFVGVEHKGWPLLFAITRRRIKAREELQTYYGEQYGDSVRFKRESDRIKSHKKQRIDTVLAAFDQNCNSGLIFSSH